jgi:hypothetical protein
MIYFSSHDRVHKYYLQDLSTCFPFLNLSNSTSSFSSDELKTQSPAPLAAQTDYQMKSNRPSCLSSSGDVSGTSGDGEMSSHEIRYFVRTTSTPFSNHGIVEV